MASKTENRQYITHSCGARWTRPSAAHCAARHRTFSSDSAFVRHRVALTCLDPETVVGVKGPRAGRPVFELRRDVSGHPIWGFPGMYAPDAT